MLQSWYNGDRKVIKIASKHRSCFCFGIWENKKINVKSKSFYSILSWGAHIVIQILNCYHCHCSTRWVLMLPIIEMNKLSSNYLLENPSTHLLTIKSNQILKNNQFSIFVFIYCLCIIFVIPFHHWHCQLFFMGLHTKWTASPTSNTMV